MISVVVPYYKMHNAEYFLDRCIASIKSQEDVEYEIVITENNGGWSSNHNEGIREAKGDIIKILHMDDFLDNPYALKTIENNFKGGWLVTGCVHTHNGKDRENYHTPQWTDDLYTGNNKIGGPSVLAFENKDPLYFDEDMTWLVDCDYYLRLFDRYGPPTIIENTCVVIGLHSGQATNLIAPARKAEEVELMKQRYV